VSNLIFGRNPVLEALRDGRPISRIWLQQGTRGELEKEIRHYARENVVPVSFVPKIKIDKLVKGNHQGVVALIAPTEFTELEDLVPFLFESGKTPLLVVLDGITDVRNIGAIARSAEVLGADAIVVPVEGSGMLNEDAVKSSAGALLKIPVCRVKKIGQALDFLSASGILLVAADLQAETSVYDVDLTEPLALLLGSEGEGLSVKSLERADHRFIIPQSGDTDSLNVSVSCGIILYEISRQRTTKA
jgi:23S rRNA (guanosine2251-2'-O)-methyltransferase